MRRLSVLYFVLYLVTYYWASSSRGCYDCMDKQTKKITDQNAGRKYMKYGIADIGYFFLIVL